MNSQPLISSKNSISLIEWPKGFTNQQKIRVLLACQAIDITMPFVIYKQISDWLGIYQYILPANRELSFEMLAYLLEGCKDMECKSRKIFTAWLLGDMIEGSMTEIEQDIAVRILRMRGKE